MGNQLLVGMYVVIFTLFVLLITPVAVRRHLYKVNGIRDCERFLAAQAAG